MIIHHVLKTLSVVILSFNANEVNAPYLSGRFVDGNGVVNG